MQQVVAERSWDGKEVNWAGSSAEANIRGSPQAPSTQGSRSGGSNDYLYPDPGPHEQVKLLSLGSRRPHDAISWGLCCSRRGLGLVERGCHGLLGGVHWPPWPGQTNCPTSSLMTGAWSPTPAGDLWELGSLWVELCPSKFIYRVLIPSASECDLVWKKAGCRYN